VASASIQTGLDFAPQRKNGQADAALSTLFPEGFSGPHGD
jgi:hypothetical protein